MQGTAGSMWQDEDPERSHGTHSVLEETEFYIPLLSVQGKGRCVKIKGDGKLLTPTYKWKKERLK